MSDCKFLPSSGYKGQKYKVIYDTKTEKDVNFGWTNDSTGGVFISSIEKHPCMFNPRVIDLVKICNDDNLFINPNIANNLPKAYNGCMCNCHRMEGVKHCVPCCTFGVEPIDMRIIKK